MPTQCYLLIPQAIALILKVMLSVIIQRICVVNLYRSRLYGCRASYHHGSIFV